MQSSIARWAEGNIGDLSANSAIPFDIFKAILGADVAAVDDANPQNWFATGPGVTVLAGQRYLMDALLIWGGTGAATTHTTAISMAGTATLTALGKLHSGSGKTIDEAATATNSAFGISKVATSIVVAPTNTLEGGFINCVGALRVNAGGTIIPQFTFSGAPGNTPLVLAGTYFRLIPVPAEQGVWA